RSGSSVPRSRARQIGWVDPARRQQRPELPEPRRFDLPDTLAGEPEPLADGLELLRRIALEPEAPPQHGALVRGEIVERRDQVRALAEQRPEHVARVGGPVDDQIADATLALADRRIDRQRMLPDRFQLLDLLFRNYGRRRQP